MIRASAINFNANGWISGYGTYSTETRGWVLIPVDDYRNNWCNHDIANPGGQCPNGVVDVYDLFYLLANWNTDGPGAELEAPTDIVNASDLFNLLASWSGNEESPCPEENIVGPLPGSLEDQVTGAGLTMNDWEDFEDVMMDVYATEKEKDNYKCWMMNYLSGCTTCPPCPDEDPYD